MISREELYHTIEQYLGKQLDVEALTAFEDRLSKEPELRQEVELHRKIQKELGDATKRNLRNKLDQLRIEHTIEESEHKVVPLNANRNWRRVISIAASVLLFGFLLWLLVFREPVKNEIVEDPIEQKEENKLPSEDIIKEEPNSIVEDKTPESEKEKLPPSNDQVKVPKENALASLTPNPVFENLLSQNGVQDKFVFDVEKFNQSKLKLSPDESVFFQLNGQLTTSNPEDKNQVIVAVFKNDATDYDLTKAASNFSLPLSKQAIEKNDIDDEEGMAFGEKEVYDFNLKQEIKLTPGLYYYTFSLEQNPRVLYCNKFTVIK